MRLGHPLLALTTALALSLAVLLPGSSGPAAAQGGARPAAGAPGTAPGEAAADQPATLVADTVYIDADGVLTAQGSVEVFHGTARLRASRITYDPDTERLQIEGPITLIEDGGETIVLASQADIATDMTDGILTGARLVLNRQLQIAGTELARSSGRFNRMTRVRASSCEVCANRPVPLWEIRATRVIHDEVERQLYFDNAQFRVAGLPVFWLPHMRIPDPTLKRTRGFLMPSIRSTSGLGPGIKLPYFIPIGDSRDLTVTPYYSTSRTRTLELRYREAFRNGTMELNGGISRDDLEPGKTRGYLFGTGEFKLPDDFKLSFGIELVTDKAYLSDYGITDDDRLETGVEISRTRRNEYSLVRLTGFRTLRDNEDNETLPTLVFDFDLQRRFTPLILGGEGGFRFSTHGHRRVSDEDTDANGDGVVDGRDVARVSLGADWRRNWVLQNGMILSGLGSLDADFYSIGQDADYPGTVARLTPQLAVELRWPWLRGATAPGGASWMVEPVAQLAWSPKSNARVPNEDSLLVEFDESSLFGLDRFPGSDRHETGLRANLGFSVTRYAPSGWSLAMTTGRVFRESGIDQFGASTGLSGHRSDWMLATQIGAPTGLTLTNRAIFDDSLDFSRDELRLAWSAEAYSVSSGYIWLAADPTEDRLVPTSEWVLDANWGMGDNWAATVESRYDFEADRMARAGLGLQYANECVTVDLSLSRRFTSSTSVRATTGFDLAVVLNGFGSGTKTSAIRRGSCG